MADRPFIFGSGGHAHVIASMIEGDPVFITPQASSPDETAEERFFGDLDRVRPMRVYIGIGDNEARRRIFAKLVAHGVRVASCIGPNTFVARDARLGDGVVLCPGSVVGSGAVIGDNTIVNTLSSVDHGCAVGAHSQLAAGVTLGGGVKIGLNCFLGVKCAVIPDIAIGDDVSVMAGALVVSDVPDGVLVGGNPARIMKRIKERS
jgi:sugar O-acyltransferase (sialic acid O-acetyltransferase NeuD family)